MSQAIRLRPATDSDQPFLLALLASTRPELSLLDGVTRSMLLRMQYDAQLMHYRSQYPQMEASIVLADGQAAGRTCVARGPQEIRLLDISLLPEYRSRQIGRQLLAQLQGEAQQAGLPLRLHVRQDNPAQHLYRRLGFAPRELAGLYRQMEWHPNLQKE